MQKMRGLVVLGTASSARISTIDLDLFPFGASVHFPSQLSTFSPADCLFECNAGRVEALTGSGIWKRGVNFSIGEPAGVKYKPEVNECLAECSVEKTCSRRQKEVSKAGSRTLCCRPRNCSHNALTGILEPYRKIPQGLEKRPSDQSSFNVTTAKMLARFVGVAYFMMNQTAGQNAEACIRSGALEMPPTVQVEVIKEVQITHRYTGMGALVMRSTFNGSSVKGDIVVAFPGTIGTGFATLHSMGQIIRQATSRYLEKMHPMPELVSGITQNCSSCMPSVVKYYGRGFDKMWQAVLTAVYKAISDFEEDAGHKWNGELYVTGHSLGGALAAIAAPHLQKQLTYTQVRDSDWRPNLYTFGAPRVGNPLFAHMVENTTRAWRVTHSTDPVPHWPGCKGVGNSFSSRCDNRSKYLHPGVEIFYPGEMEGAHEREFFECPLDEDPTCKLSTWALSTLKSPVGFVQEHMQYFGVPTKYYCDPDTVAATEEINKQVKVAIEENSEVAMDRTATEGVDSDNKEG